MADSGDIDARVLALFELLKKRDLEKIEECGEEIVEAAGENSSDMWFEPEQIVKMLDIWMDACAAGVDGEVMDTTAQVLSEAQVEESEFPGLAGVLKKMPKALSKQTPGYFDSMLAAVLSSATMTNKDLFPPLGEVLKHPKCSALDTALEVKFGTTFSNMQDWSDEDAAAAVAVMIDLARHLAKELCGHTPGNMNVSKALTTKAKCMRHMFTGANVFLMMQTTSHPKARSAISAPAVVLELQKAIKALKLKPKENDLKEAASELEDTCGSLLGNMPTDAGGGATASEATELLEAATSASDKDTLQGLLGMMAACKDPEAVDKLLARDSLGSVLAVFQKITKGPYDYPVWQAFQRYLIWAMENRPESTDAAADEIVKAYIQGPVAGMQPKAFVDAAAEKSPRVAQALWSKFSAWRSNVGSTKGTDSYPAHVLCLVQAVNSLPSVLEGKDLSQFCREMMQLAGESAGTAIVDGMNIGALVAMRAVVAKDKAQVPKDALTWVKQLQQSAGSSRDAATAFMDAYEGRSLAGAYEQIEEMNAKFKENCGSMEDLKAYVDQNVNELKDFIGDVVKKLPVPVKFSAEQRYVVQMVMLLHFECQASPKTRCCALPEGTFTTATYEVNRWLKIGLSAAKIGKSILTADAIGDVPGIVDQVKGMYDMYKTKQDGEDDFLTFVSEPFLTSKEQDKLLGQLKGGGFFDRFCYDNQTAKWVCANCYAVKQLAGPRAGAGALERACTDLEATLPMPVGGMPPAGESLKEQAKHAQDGISEVKKTGHAYCSLFDGIFKACGCKPEEEEEDKE